MDNSCNQVRDISCNLIKIDLSSNVNMNYCKTCNKLMPNTFICYNELCICQTDLFNGLTGIYSYIDCSNSSFFFGNETGPTGPTGFIGPIGQIGPTGPTGQQGSMGEMGPTGPIGPTGLIGSTGQQGSAGEMGPTGPIGPTGPVGNTFITNGLIYQSFITAYSMIEQILSVDEPITFDTHSIIFGECLHEENTPDLWFWNPGNYMVSMNICSTERGQFSVIKNLNSIIPGGTVGINIGSAQTNVTFIMLIEDTDLIEPIPTLLNKNGCRIQVVNTSSLTDTVTLYGSSTTGNPIPQITASITIIRLTP